MMIMIERNNKELGTMQLATLKKTIMKPKYNNKSGMNNKNYGMKD